MEMEFDSQRIIQGLVYVCNTSAAQPSDLASKILKTMRNPKNDLASIIKGLVSIPPVRNFPRNREEATALILNQEAEKLISFLSNCNSDMITDPISLKDKIIEIFANHGLDIPYADVFLVDTFPNPYSDMPFSAMHYDISDSDDLGVPAGVYMRKDRLTPFLSTYLLAHEFVHSCFSYRPSEELVRGFEEGIADLLAASVCAEIFGVKQAWGILRGMRLNYPRSQFWNSYVIALRQAALFSITSNGGLWDLARKIRINGRQLLFDIEFDLYRDASSQFQGLQVETSKLDQQLALMILSFPTSYVVSPEAYCLASERILGSNIKFLAHHLNVERDFLQKTLEELQQSLFLVLIDKDTVVSDLSKHYLEAENLRYSLEN